MPEPVVIANGVVFALSNGENTQQSKEGGIIFKQKLTLLSDQQRRENANPSGSIRTGCQNRKDSLPERRLLTPGFTSAVSRMANGSIYAVDHGSQVYCFGLKEN